MEGELIENNGLDIYDTSETPKKRGRPAKYNEKNSNANRPIGKRRL